MDATNPNFVIIERVAVALGDLRETLVFVGGCAASLLITDPAEQIIRPTDDVDVVVEVATLSQYYKIEDQLQQLGFKRDTGESPVNCRWELEDIKVDVMPTNESILGFSNPWYAKAIQDSTQYVLPSSINIRLITAPLLIATKLVAFEDRGAGDFLASHDIEDILAIVDGRESLIAELQTAAEDVRKFIAQKIAEYLEESAFTDAVGGFIYAAEGSSSRLPILMSRLEAIASWHN